MPRTYIGRFAPSPTGPAHLGIAAAALVAWLDARAHQGKLRLRIEDVDETRRRPGMAEEIVRDLHWMGLDFDGETVTQSENTAAYTRALDQLRAEGRTFPCTCSRRDIERAASAPHLSDDFDARVYPGTCRLQALAPGTPHAVRLKVDAKEAAAVQIKDRVHGVSSENVHASVGDFVLKRKDGLYAYQLAVVVDDVEAEITDVVRGRDLASSAARQNLIRRYLGATDMPAYVHVPVLTDAQGQRLSTRKGAAPLAALREQGWRPHEVIGRLAHSLGLIEKPVATELSELISKFDAHRLRASEVRAPDFSVRPP